MRTTLLAAALLFLSTAASAGTVTVSVDGAEAGGPVRLMLFQDAESFARRSGGGATAVLPAGAGRAAVSLHHLPPGRYAVAAFQDGNGNEVLDTGLFGIPSEPYGTSNGAGDFDGAAVALGEGEVVVEIILR